MTNTTLYKAFEAEIDGFFQDAHKPGYEQQTLEDWTNFLDDRLDDIIEVHELEDEDPQAVYTTFVELYKKEA